MRTWRSKLLLPKEYIEQERLSQEAKQTSSLWPICPVCTKKNKFKTEVTAYGVKDFGKLPGTTGEHYTDFFAKCHGQEDIIRIEGFRWDKAVKDLEENIARLAAIKALPFFYNTASACRCIPLHVMLNFLSAQRNATL